jgi:hypothetical protein
MLVSIDQYLASEDLNMSGGSICWLGSYPRKTNIEFPSSNRNTREIARIFADWLDDKSRS